MRWAASARSPASCRNGRRARRPTARATWRAAAHPVLLLNYTADQSTFPSTRDAWMAAAPGRVTLGRHPRRQPLPGRATGAGGTGGRPHRPVCRRPLTMSGDAPLERIGPYVYRHFEPPHAAAAAARPRGHRRRRAGGPGHRAGAGAPGRQQHRHRGRRQRVHGQPRRLHLAPQPGDLRPAGCAAGDAAARPALVGRAQLLAADRSVPLLDAGVRGPAPAADDQPAAVLHRGRAAGRGAARQRRRRRRTSTSAGRRASMRWKRVPRASPWAWSTRSAAARCRPTG